MTAARVPESLEDAIYQVVHDGALPPKALAGAAGMRTGYLLDAANPHREETHFQARFIIPITRASQNDAIVRFIAEAVGGVFVRFRHQETSDQHTARALREFADYIAAVDDSKADGVVTVGEVAEVERQANDVIAALVAHVAHLRNRATVEPKSRPMEVTRMA